MVTFPGRYSPDNKGAVAKQWTVEEAAKLIKDGSHYGMFSFKGIFGSYTIDGIEYPASGLTVSKDHGIPFERNGKVIVPTYFRRFKLAAKTGGEGNPEDLVSVEVEMDPSNLYLTLVKEK